MPRTSYQNEKKTPKPTSKSLTDMKPSLLCTTEKVDVEETRGFRASNRLKNDRIFLSWYPITSASKAGITFKQNPSKYIIYCFNGEFLFLICLVYDAISYLPKKINYLKLPKIQKQFNPPWKRHHSGPQWLPTHFGDTVNVTHSQPAED